MKLSNKYQVKDVLLDSLVVDIEKQVGFGADKLSENEMTRNNLKSTFKTNPLL